MSPSRRRRARIAAAVVAGVSSGLLLTLASPAVGVGWLGWVALAPAAAATFAWPHSRAGRLAVPVAYAVYLEALLVPALPFGIADGQWGDPPPVMIAGSPLLFVALVAVPLFGLALHGIRFGAPWLADELRGPLRTIALVAVPAAAFAALDFLRVGFDPGGFWGPLFLSQYDTAGAEIAAFGSPWLLSYALAASGYAAGLAIARATGAVSAPGRRLALAAAVPALPVALALAAGATAADERSRLTVAAVQPGYDTSEDEREVLRYWHPGTHHLAALDLIEDLGGMSARAAEQGAELIVWPEASLFVDPAEWPRVDSALRELAARIDAVLLVPYFVYGESTSAVVAVTPEGEVTPPRAKARAMWFLGERPGDGAGDPAPLVVDEAAIGTLLGVDNEDPALGAARAREGAEVLASSTHDWGALAVQQRAFASINARVAQRALIRADWRYGSFILDREGEAVADAGLELRRAVLVAEVALATGKPGSLAGGGAIGWAFVALSAAAAGVSLARRGRRATRKESEPLQGASG